MTYEDELDIQIEALEKELFKRKRNLDFWIKVIPTYEKLFLKWDIYIESMFSNRADIAFDLEIMSILIKHHCKDDPDLEKSLRNFVLPIIKNYEKDGSRRV
jgi:hypothetical protein